MTRFQARLVGLLLLALPACASGQTGSPDCPGTGSCVCDAVLSRALLRATLDELDGDNAILTIDEVLAPASQTLDLAVGDRIGGAVKLGPPCANADAGSRELAPGASVFVAYSRGGADTRAGCTEYRQCTTAKCDVLERGNKDSAWTACDEQCSSDTANVCSTHRAQALLSGRLLLLPWSDVLDFGADSRVDSRELGALVEPGHCFKLFPTTMPPPCNDTVANTCSVRHPGRAGAGLTTLLLLVALLVWRHRKRSGSTR